MIRTELKATSTADLEKLISDYFRTYPTAGYGTLVVKNGFDGVCFYAILERSKTCD